MKTKLIPLLLILTVAFLSNALASDRLTLVETGFETVERSYGHVTGAWKVKLKNNTEEDVRVSITINYLDKDKLKLDFSFENATLKPDETKTISDTKMFTEEVWNKIKNYETKVEEQ
jgi:hypothetical protein